MGDFNDPFKTGGKPSVGNLSLLKPHAKIRGASSFETEKGKLKTQPKLKKHVFFVLFCFVFWDAKTGRGVEERNANR